MTDRPKATLIDLQAAIDPSSPQFNQAISEMIERNRPGMFCKATALATRTVNDYSSAIEAITAMKDDEWLDGYLDDEDDRAEDV